LDLWHIQPIGDVDVPYWDVKVDPAIIKDHGDIWNPKAQAMMAAVFRMTNPLINRETKIKRRAVLKKEPTRPTVAPEPDQSRPRPPRKVKNDPAAKPAPKPRAESPFERTR
jgi:hypothetical protein